MILEENRFREALSIASRTLCDTVSTTFGQKGGNVLISKGMQVPFTTKDGYTVANYVEYEDQGVNAIIQNIKEVSNKTVDGAGDGTTTSIVLVNAIIQNTISKIDTYTSVYDLKKEIDVATDFILSEIDKLKKDVTDEDIYKIALTSCNFDKEVAKTIQEAFSRTGKTGFVDIKKSADGLTTLESQSGFIMPSGYFSQDFLGNNSSVIECINPRVVIFKDLLNDMEEVQKIHNESPKRPIVLVAHDFSKKVMDDLLVSRIRHKIEIYPVKTPFVGDRKVEIANDLSSYLTDDGVDSVLITKNKTIFTNQKAKVEGRVKVIQETLEQIDDQLEKEFTQDRISNLTGQSCTIYIGSFSDIEFNEKLDRYDDALKAVKSSIEEGYLAGGGSALLYIAEKNKEKLSETIGGEIMYESIVAPCRTLLSNANISFNAKRKQISAQYGISVDLRDGKIKDLVKNHIVDSAKVTKTALQSASSVACALITTKKMIIL